MPGWHRPHEFGAIATALAKRELVLAPNDLRLFVRSDRVTDVVVSVVARLVRDDAFGPPVTEGVSGPLSKPVPSVPRSSVGRRIRLPFEPEEKGTLLSKGVVELETRPVNWAALRMLRPVFEGPDLIHTVFQDLKIGGSPSLTIHEGWNSALDHVADCDPYLRAYPIMISPNAAYIEVRSVLEGNAPAIPYLLAEVMRNDAFQN